MATMDDFKDVDVDQLLDAIDQREQAPLQKINWNEVESQIKEGYASTYVKQLISSKEYNINEINPSNGMSLLIYCVIIGNLELVKIICDFGGNITIKDNSGKNALTYARIYGRYHITELLYYQELSQSLGKDLKYTTTQLYEKQKEATFFIDNCATAMHEIIIYLADAMEKRGEFSNDLLFYAWYYIQSDEYKGDEMSTDGFNFEQDYHEKKIDENNHTKEDPLKSKLFLAMMTAYEEILSNTHDRDGWKWLRKHFIPSYIWYLPHPHIEQKSSDDNMENLLQKTMFIELLKRVKAESKKQADVLLKEKIDKIKMDEPDEWNQLIGYNAVSTYSNDARQDICGCLIPKYTKSDLNQYRTSTHFSPTKHYDQNIYLNEMLFNANILDDIFQKHVKQIVNEIKNKNPEIMVKYRAGPIKKLDRAQTKVSNDYIDAKFPTAAKVIDLNRCALQFDDIKALLLFLNEFEQKIQSKDNQYCIKSIVRSKNGWAAFNEDSPSYTDIKLNVLVKTSTGLSLLAEMQFLMTVMSSFKKVAHKLYSIQRNEEFVYAFSKLREKMRKFSDCDVFINLAKSDSIEQFQLLWNLIISDGASLMGQRFGIAHIISKNGQILNFIVKQHKNLYFDAIECCINKFSSLQMMESIDDSEIDGFFATLIDSLNDNKELLFKFLSNKDPRDDYKNATVLMAICKTGNISALKTILQSKCVTEQNKFELLCDKGGLNHYSQATPLIHACQQGNKYCCQCAGEILKYIESNNKKLILLLTQTDIDSVSDDECNAVMRIVNHKENDEILKFLLQTTKLSKEEKFKLFSFQDNKDRSTLIWAADGLLQDLWHYLKQNYSDKQLASLMIVCANHSARLGEEHIVSKICTEQSGKYLDLLKWIFNTSEITNEKKRELSISGLPPAFELACRGHPKYVFEILNYVQNLDQYDLERLFAINMSEFDIAMSGGWTPLMVFSGTLLNKANKGIMEYESVFSYLNQFIAWILKNIKTSNSLSKLFNAKNQENKTIFDLTQLKIFKECMECIEFKNIVIDNSEFNESKQILNILSEYKTNVIFTLCNFGDYYQVIKHLFDNYLTSPKDRLNLLLTTKKNESLFLRISETEVEIKLNEYEEKQPAIEYDKYVDNDYISENNCFMVASLNGNTELVSFMLEGVVNFKLELLSQKNKLSESVLMLLCRDNEKLQMIKILLKSMSKTNVIQLLNETNKTGQNCFQIAEKSKATNVFKYIQSL